MIGNAISKPTKILAGDFQIFSWWIVVIWEDGALNVLQIKDLQINSCVVREASTKNLRGSIRESLEIVPSFAQILKLLSW